MYYRQKVLVGLLQIIRKPIPKTKLQKMLFLLGQEHRAEYYHFFPHKYGCYSMILDNDIQKLLDKGILRQSEEGLILVDSSDEWVRRLKKRDRAALRALAARFALKSTKDVVRYVYLNYPEYTSRSAILTKVLSEEERHAIRQRLLASEQTTSLAVFSIGYEGLDIDQYIARLLANHVAVLVDVRHNPFSMKFDFTKKRLSQALKNVGIAYVHLPELGIPSDKRKPLQSDDDNTYRHRLFREYRETLQDKQEALRRLVSIIEQHTRVALTCFEAKPEQCHRQVLIDYLTEHAQLPGVEVRHL